jgi:hypothetical protein
MERSTNLPLIIPITVGIHRLTIVAHLSFETSKMTGIRDIEAPLESIIPRLRRRFDYAS